MTFIVDKKKIFAKYLKDKKICFAFGEACFFL